MFVRALHRQFSSLAEYNYRLFFIGQGVSQIGTWMQTVGQGWLVLQLTGSAAALGIVTMLQAIPFTVLSLVGGVLADRLPKRKALIIVQTFATLQAAVLSALVIFDVVQIWHVYVLAFLLGLTNAIERPTRQSFFSEIVSKERLVNAVALNSSLLNTARILGPALGGVVIAVIGVEGTFVFNAFSFLAVLAGYFFMDAKRFYPGRSKAATGSILGQIKEGIVYGVKTPGVRFILILVLFIGMFGYNFNVVTPLVAKFILHAGPGRFGLLSSFLGAGALLSAFLVAGFGRNSPRLMLAASAVFCLFLFALGFSTSYLVSGLLLFALGVSGTLLMTLANTTLQLGAPDGMRGRIISIFILLQAGSTPIGGYMIGQLSSSLGVRDALVIHSGLSAIGVLIAAIVGWQLLMPNRRAPAPEIAPAQADAAG